MFETYQLLANVEVSKKTLCNLAKSFCGSCWPNWKVDVLVFAIYLVGTWESAERKDILIKYTARATSQ
jgi:hypothetical protein